MSGIPELIDDGRTGLLVIPRDRAALQRSLQVLITTPALRAKLGSAGFERVHDEFSFCGGIDRIDALFRRCGVGPDRTGGDAVRGPRP
jgi:glycosyltransferase involved in cell wall biosynthesis